MKSLIAIILSLSSLVAQLGLTVNAHYCAGFMVRSSISLGEEQLDCGMHAAEADHSHHWDGQSSITDPCCEESHASFLIEGDWAPKRLASLTVDYLAIAAPVVGLNFLPELPVFQSAWAGRAPPLLKLISLNVLHQVFRI